MKTIAKSTASSPKRHSAALSKRVRSRRIVVPTTAEERELRAAIRLAQADYIQRFPERAPSPAEHQAREASIKALLAAWQEEERRNPPTREECESYDRMLERMQRERAG